MDKSDVPPLDPPRLAATPTKAELLTGIRRLIGMANDALQRALGSLSTWEDGYNQSWYVDHQLFQAGEWIANARQLTCVESAIEDGAIPLETADDAPVTPYLFPKNEQIGPYKEGR